MPSAYSISVVVPVHNERALVHAAVSRLSEFLRSHFTDFEILVIESGSTDGTTEICRNLSPSLPNVRVFFESKRSGFGSAIRLGISKATKDLIWPVTVDFPFPIETILRALPLLDENDSVVSYRSEDPRTVVRRLQSFGYTHLVRTIFGIRAREVNSAFKVFKRRVIQPLPLKCAGWSIDAEIHFYLSRKRSTFVEIPVPLIDRVVGRSSIGYWTFLSVLKELFRLRRDLLIS